MTYTRADLRNELKDAHLGSTYWSDTKLNYYIATAIGGLYPTWWKRKVGTTTAGAGPLQTKPTSASNIYEIAIHDAAAPGRPRWLRGWSEGATDAYIPVTQLGAGAITGKTLVWSYTTGWDIPGDDVTGVDLTNEAKEVVILKAKEMALQSLLTDHLIQEKYLAQQVRPLINEQEIMSAIDSIHQALQMKAQLAMKLPEVQR